MAKGPCPGTRPKSFTRMSAAIAAVDNHSVLGYLSGMLDIKQDLIQIKKAGLYRKPVRVCSPPGPKVNVEGREVLMMASNDYLGLCSHPRIKKRAQQVLQEWGAGSGASRLISGNISLFADLEKRLAGFKETEAALVFNSGYTANAGLLTALADRGDIIYSDELNHASIIDGCRLSRAKTAVYPHRDMDKLESLLKKGGRYRRRIIVTDGVFSMDGDLAPVPVMADLAQKHGAALIVDDAHGTGVLGENGKGTMEHFGLSVNTETIIMGTMGKAMGCFGAFVAGSKLLKEFLINRSRNFIFTTALPPSVIGSALEALQIIEDEPERRLRLKDNYIFLRNTLNDLGFNTLASETQIIPIMMGDSATAVKASRYLFEAGLFVQPIRPPTVPEGSSRLRLTVMATHTKDDIGQALAILESAGKRFRII